MFWRRISGRSAFPIRPFALPAAISPPVRRFYPADSIRPSSSPERQVFSMRLFAFPAALFLAFILYCAAPKLAEWLPRAFQKLFALFGRLDERAPRELAFPAFLLTLMLGALPPRADSSRCRSRADGVPALRSFVHPRERSGQARTRFPARMQGISPLTKPSSVKRAPRWLPPSSRMSVRRSC